MKSRDLLSRVHTGLGILPRALLISVLLCLPVDSPLLAQQDKLTVSLKSREFTPKAGIESEILSTLQTNITTEGGTPHVMIQLTKLPSLLDKDLLNGIGVKLLNYVGNNTWYASISDAKALQFADPAEIGREPLLGSIRWMGQITPEDKTATLIRENRIGDWARSPDGKANLVISYFSDVDAGYVKSQLEMLNAVVLGEVPVVNNMTIAIDESRIADIAAKDFVIWIETVPPPCGPESNRIRSHVQADLAQAAPSNLTGNGTNVGVFEWNHIWQTHADFSGRAVRKDATTYDPGQHTTMVAGIIGGNGSQSGANGGSANQWRGMASSANLYSYNANSGGTTAQDYLNYTGDLQAAIGTDKIDVANNSWGTTTGCDVFPYGAYEGLCPTLDAAVRGDFGKPVAIVFSAGNERNGYGWDAANAQQYFDCITSSAAPFANYATMNYPKASKNIIAVGAVDSDNDPMTDYSSWGPLADGRIKPDIVASGHHNGTSSSGITILDNAFGSPTGSANQQGYRTPNYTTATDTWVYAWMTQTSCAAAVTSGCLALLLEHYRSTQVTDIDPLPSTMKAILIHSAQDLDDNTSWYNPGPDYASGYGLLQIKDATDLVGSSLFREGKVTTNRSDHYTFTLPANANSVKVTLVWDDPPAAANAAVAIINDLDLQVFDPNTTQHYPWTLNPANPSANAVSTVADHINNVEQVFVNQNLTAGTWTVVVDPYALPQPPQRYSLVANYLLDGDIDVFQVLDRSGSMGGTATAGMPDTKIQKLRDASSQFIGIMRPNVGNRLGLVQFNQNVVPFPANAEDALSVLDGNKANQLQTVAVPSIVHGGSTSIGDGLQEALNGVLSASAEPEHDRAILLVTDGKENTPLWISDVQSNLINDDVTVFALGLGYGSGINESKLVDLAEATGGTYRITSDHLVFQKLFIETLAGAVDWSVINDPVGTISVGEVIQVPVVVAPDQVGVTFTAYWEGFNDAIDLELITPSGNVISSATENANIRCGQHSRYIFYQLDFPLIGGLADEWAGEWQVKLTGVGQLDDSVEVRYSTSAFAEDGPELDVTLSKLANLTGDEIEIIAHLSRGGLPLSGATMDVFGDVPLTGAGNVLHEGKVSWDQLQQIIVVDGDTLSMIDRKLQILSKQMGKDVLQRGTANFRLYDDGLHGDETANDGIYANKFTETETQGSYTFRFVASGIPAGGGLHSTCEWTESFYDEVSIDPDYSDFGMTFAGATANGQLYGVRVVPKDRFGNYLGPGHAVTATIVSPDGRRQVDLIDSVDGVYAKEILLTSSEIEGGGNVEIDVDEKTFTTVAPDGRKWSLSLHAGVAVPTGSFANNFDPGLNVLVDVDYHFSPQVSLVGLFGYNDFKSKTAGVQDNYLINLSANLRYYHLLGGPWSVYLGAGPGLYVPEFGDTELGANVGFGLDYDYNGAIHLELGADYHLLFDSDVEFIHSHVGVNYRF